MKEMVRTEILKLLEAGIIYPIDDSRWVSPVHCVPKKGGITVVPIDKNELMPLLGKRHLWDHEDPFYGWRGGGLDCTKSRSGRSAQGIFTQVWATEECKTLVLFECIFGFLEP